LSHKETCAGWNASRTTPTRSALDGAEINGLAQPRGEAGHDRFGVVTGPVEAAVDRALDPFAQRVEQRRDGQSRGRHRYWSGCCRQ
jgi:hypothetical protein